jgi:hypothetical protein
LKGGFSDHAGAYVPEVAPPPIEEPCRAREFNRFVRPRNWRPVNFAEHGIHETGGGAVANFDVFDGVVNCGMRGDAIKVSKLKNRGANSDQDRKIQRIRRAAGILLNEKIELA